MITRGELATLGKRNAGGGAGEGGYLALIVEIGALLNQEGLVVIPLAGGIGGKRDAFDGQRLRRWRFGSWRAVCLPAEQTGGKRLEITGEARGGRQGHEPQG